MPEPRDIQIEARFPLAGIDQSGPICRQMPREMKEVGEYGRTCYSGVNTRAFDTSDRMRGGSRPGLRKYCPQAVGGITGWLCQELAVIVVTNSSAQL